MQKAIKLSRKSIEMGGFPVGALVVKDDEIVGEGISNGKQENDATSHAEIMAIRKASEKLKKRDLKNAIVYSSMEPCLMCFSACYWAGVKRIVFAISKDQLSKKHYEGLYNLNEIDEKNNRSIELEHIEGLEASALKVVKEWEEFL